MPLNVVPAPLPVRRPARAAQPKRPAAHLSKASKAWWREVVDEFELGPHHLRLLRVAAEAWDRCQQAREMVDVEGLTVVDRFGQSRAHPAVAIERDARLAFARLVRELGLDDGPEPDPRLHRRGGR